MLKLPFMLGKKNPDKPTLYCSGAHCFLKLQTTSSQLKLYIGVWTGVRKSWPSAGWWSVQTKQRISMCLRSLQRKKIPSLCTQKQMCGTRQCANCANSNSIQTMAKLDLLRQGCLLFSVFLETKENTDSGQENGQASVSQILHIHWICFVWEE